MNRTWILGLLMGGWGLGLGAQNLDSGLKVQLDQAGLKYSATKSGNAQVVFTEADDRSQVVYLRGTADTLDGLSLREIWSVAGTLEPDPDPQVLLDLLSAGGDEALGAWNLEKADDGWLVYYSTKLPADMPGTNLRSVVETIADVTDRKEKALFATDDN